MKKFGYGCLFRGSPSSRKQKALFADCKASRFDSLDSRSSDRPGLPPMLKALRHGDELVIAQLDILGSNAGVMMKALETAFAAGATVDSGGTLYDDRSDRVALIEECETMARTGRTKNARDAAEGRTGRKADDKMRNCVRRALADTTLKPAQIADECGCSVSTVYNIKREN